MYCSSSGSYALAANLPSSVCPICVTLPALRRQHRAGRVHALVLPDDRADGGVERVAQRVDEVAHAPPQPPQRAGVERRLDLLVARSLLRVVQLVVVAEEARAAAARAPGW